MANEPGPRGRSEGMMDNLFKPYYDEDGITIYHGDCRQVLPFLGQFDLLLTDPPYGMKLNTDNSRFSGGDAASVSRRGTGIGTANGEPVIGDDEPFDPTFLLFCCEQNIIWGWNHFADKLPKGSLLVWLKRHDEAFGSFLSDAEVAWKSSGCGVFCRRDLSNNAITRERVHPTQKPVSLMCWCMSFYPKAETILDPFMGSGTTLLAAKLEGRRAVGIEINERYCESAVNRLRQKVLF